MFIRHDALGIRALAPVEYEIRNSEVVYADHGPIGVLVTEQHVGPTIEPTLSDLSAALITVYGTDYGNHSPTSISGSPMLRDRRPPTARDAC